MQRPSSMIQPQASQPTLESIQARNNHNLDPELEYRVWTAYGPNYMNKPETVSWLDWYNVWTKDDQLRPDPIGRNLELSIPEAGTRLLTQDGHVVVDLTGVPNPSLRYQGIDLLLRTAIKRRDIQALRRLVQEVMAEVEEAPLPPGPVRSKIITLGIKAGLYDEVKDLIPAMTTYLAGLSNKEIGQLTPVFNRMSIAFGYTNDLLSYQTIKKGRASYEQRTYPYFVMGLIRGGYDQLAIDLIPKMRWFSWPDLIMKVARTAVAVNASAVVQQLKTYIDSKESTADETAMEDIKMWLGLGLLDGGDIAGALEYEDFISPPYIVEILTKRDPEGAVVYMQSIPHQDYITIAAANQTLIDYCEEHSIPYVIDVELVTKETLAMYHARHPDKIINPIHIVRERRYDLFEDWLHHSETRLSPDDIADVVRAAATNSMNDIMVLMLTQYKVESSVVKSIADRVERNIDSWTLQIMKTYQENPNLSAEELLG